MSEKKMHPIHVEPQYLEAHGEPRGTGKHILSVFTIVIILMVCVLCAFRLGELEPTFNGEVDVYALEQDPQSYDLTEADGAAYVIVSKNLAETAADNVCFSVVFNFRGYDTMGESFILIAALSGSLCILRTVKKKKAPKEKEEEVTGHEE